MRLFDRNQVEIVPFSNVDTVPAVYGKKHISEKKSIQFTKCIALKYFECLIPSCFKRQENIGLKNTPMQEHIQKEPSITTRRKLKREFNLHTKEFKNLENKKISSLLIHNKSIKNLPTKKIKTAISSHINFEET